MDADKFEELPPEKRMRIINAGLECFGQYGYKKANTDLIVQKAGISKGALFYYFKNKEAFYLYLCKFCSKVSAEAVDVTEMNAITDFFDMLDFAMKTKLRVLAEYPYMYDFSLRMVLFQDEKVSSNINNYLDMAFKDIFHEYFKNIDFSCFKEEVEPEYIYKMFLWLSEGYLSEMHRANRPIVFTEAIAEFEKWKTMLKKVSYREEYL